MLRIFLMIHEGTRRVAKELSRFVVLGGSSWIATGVLAAVCAGGFTHDEARGQHLLVSIALDPRQPRKQIQRGAPFRSAAG
jgi:hypothetical protein